MILCQHSLSGNFLHGEPLFTCACCARRIESGRSVGPHTPGKAGDSLQLAFRPSGLTGFIFTKNMTIYEALYAVLNGVE
jgi:hypothetical protein